MVRNFYIFIAVFIFLVVLSGFADDANAQCACQAPPPTGGYNCGDGLAGAPDCVDAEFTDSLTGTESGGDYQCLQCDNQEALGRYQFMDGTREQVANETGLPCDVSVGDFAHCPQLQDACFAALTRSNYDALESCGALDAIGTTINGVEVTESGLLAAAHLGGAGGACNWVSSNGASDPNDAIGNHSGTSLTQYVSTHGGLAAVSGGGGSCPPAVTPQAPVPNCGDGEPFCTATDIGTPVRGSVPFLDIFIPSIGGFNYSRCLDRCDNSGDVTTQQNYYLYCSVPPGSSYSGYSGCCCPGQVFGGSVRPGAECTGSLLCSRCGIGCGFGGGGER